MFEPNQLQKRFNAVWHKVPAGEQLELRTESQSKALETCFVCLLFAVAMAWALGVPMLLVGTMCALPLLFQLLSTRMWREAKSRLHIRYFVASVTASRYAKTLETNDTSLKMIFRGSLEATPHSVTSNCEDMGPARAEQDDSSPIDVYVSLFPESLVMISEGDSGAKLEFARTFTSHLRIIQEAQDETLSTLQQLLIEVDDEEGNPSRWTLSSKHPETLSMCEKRIKLYMERVQARFASQQPAIEVPPEVPPEVPQLSA